jgi:GNAT superfamily N-acetyltransferase
MSYSVRKVKDLSMLVYLNKVVFPLDVLEIDEKTVGWVMYCPNGEPVGFCSGRQLEHQMFFMDRAGILEKHRGKGLHRKLINVRERFARASDKIKHIITYVVHDNYASLFTLVRCGYKKYDPEYEYAGASEKEVIYLIKDLK